MIERDLSVLVSWVRRYAGRACFAAPDVAAGVSALSPYRPYLLTHQLKQAMSMKP